MQIKVNKNDLSLGLSKVIASINPRSTLPILSNIMIETINNDQLKLTGTDLEIGISNIINANIINEGAVTVPAKKFIDIVRELPLDEIELTVNKSNSVSIKSGKSYFKLMGLPKDDYPKFPKIDYDTGINIKGEILKEAIKLTIFAISSDETRYVLNGALFEVNNNKLKLIATDGRRLALYEKDIKFNKDIELSFIIPSKALNELNKNLQNQTDIKIIDLGNQVIFAFDNLTIISRLIEGHFPNYKQVIPDDVPIKVTLNRTKLFSTVKRVSILTSLDSQALKIDLLKGEKMIVSSRSPNLGESKEEIDIEMIQGGDITIGFNPNFLLDVLKNIDVEKITLSLNSSQKPGIIGGKEGYTYVIMPMQIT